MTVELNARFISELNESYPRQGDLLKEGDDHMRLIKSCLKQTLPSFNKTINITAEDLNHFDGMTTFTADTMTFSGNLTIAAEKALDFGGNIVKNAGLAVDDGDVVTKKFFMDNIGNKAWPVGSIFISAVSTNPSELMGFGTWVQYGSGRCLMGVGSDKDDRGEAKLIALGAKGGAYNHGLVEGELAGHSHAFSATTSTNGEHTHTFNQLQIDAPSPDTKHNARIAQYNMTTYTTNAAGNHNHSVSGTTNGAGSGAAHNNTHPWIGVYFWQRTA